MQTKTWKKERNLLSEAYQSVTETTHSPENSCKDDEYYCSKDKVCKKKAAKKGLEAQGKQMEEDLKEEDIDPKAAVEMAAMDRPAGDEELPMSGEQPDDLDKDVRDLIELIANPPPEDELMRLGYEGRLSEYVAMLQKKVDAAQAQLDLQKPSEEAGS